MCMVANCRRLGHGSHHEGMVSMAVSRVSMAVGMAAGTISMECPIVSQWVTGALVAVTMAA